ncbi:MAG: hypothetical protein E3K37_11145 [Candidatus Kuenenia sp.]|nr:hypothetical protein [Candidatus Kuenenia hertensis]
MKHLFAEKEKLPLIPVVNDVEAHLELIKAVLTLEFEVVAGVASCHLRV